MPDLTLSEAVARTGRSRAELSRALAAGRVPGARKVPGGAWSIPADTLHLIDVEPGTDTTPTPVGVGVERDAGNRTGANVGQDTAPLAYLVDVARRVERALDAVTSSRSARAASDAVWRHVQTASRHDVDRDGTCRHDGWSFPCPDRLDAERAVLDAALVVLDGVPS